MAEAVAKKSKSKLPQGSKRVYYILLCVLLLLVALAVGAVYMGDKMLKKRSATLTDLKLQNHLLDEQQTALTKAQKDIENYKDFSTIAKSIVPQDKDQARAVREIIQIASESGIKIDTINFAASNLGSAIAAPSASSGGTKTAAPPISQAKPVEGIPGVYSMQIDIQPGDAVTGRAVTYYQFLDFLAKLEKNRRTSQVASIRITPISQNPINPTIDFSLSINVFVKPN